MWMGDRQPPFVVFLQKRRHPAKWSQEDARLRMNERITEMPCNDCGFNTETYLFPFPSSVYPYRRLVLCTIVHFVMQFLTWHFNESKYLIGAWISNMDSRWGKQKCMWGIQFVRKTCKYVCKCNIAVLCTYNNTKKNNFELLFFPCIVMAIGWGSKKRPLYARTSLKVVSWVIHNKEPQFFQSFASRNKNSHTYVMSLRF